MLSNKYYFKSSYTINCNLKEKQRVYYYKFIRLLL